jgi:nicotinate-nucleotide pyrophosphorylase (carboxylating)
MTIDRFYLDAFIIGALKEDIGDGDHTSLSCIPPRQKGKARLLAKQDGILAGVEVGKRIFEIFDNTLQTQVFMDDGSTIVPGDVILEVDGPELSILQCERLVLNVMQRMSGIATTTKTYVKKLEGLGTRVLDTRKTTPGMRLLDKAAVKIGGGNNHRIGLYDMILLKDNHVDYAGGIENAIDRANEYLIRTGRSLRIEIETRSIDEVKRVLAKGGVNRIMLDNFDTSLTREAVRLIDRKYETESSGNITLDTIRSYAECGVDYISVGALTHQVKSLDLSLKAVK